VVIVNTIGTNCRASIGKASLSVDKPLLEETMKTWSKPEVREQEVGLEVTSYLPAEIDLI
jgi:coenzyme PQQ precursor peptide PqqA